MRVTRRSLIQMLGLGAAAAALAPSVGQAQTAPVASGNDRYPGDTDVSIRCMSCDWRTEWTNDMRVARVIADLDAVNNHMLIDHDGMLMRTETNWQPHAETIANARADGYNRGREVESARWEARQAFSCHRCSEGFSSEDALDDHWYDSHFSLASCTGWHQAGSVDADTPILTKRLEG